MRKWGHNIEIRLEEIELEGVDCSHLAQDRLLWRAAVNTLNEFRIP